MLMSMSSEHQLGTNELNQNRLVDPYSPPFINRPSLFSSSQIQHQPFNTVVNPELPLQSPYAFQLPSTSAQSAQTQLVPIQSHGFIPSTGVPWRCPDWMITANIPSGAFMNFNGHQQARLPFKRKAETDFESVIKTKQLITDEKMAAHLNGLHISSDFTAHDTTKMDDMNSTTAEADSTPYLCSFQDIEEKLKRAQRITVSDVVREIQDEPLLPAAIMESFEKPCKALVVWQPPQRLTDLIISKAQQKEQTTDDEDADNNNVDFIDDENENANGNLNLIDPNEAQMDLDL